jgi:ABC-2 type transport system ATP-binding protein
VVVEGVGKRFGDRWVLHDVSLHVPAGQVAVLVGHNGAGKTTLLRLLATAVTLDRGRATVAGADVVADPGAVRRAIGLVLGDDRSHFWRLSGAENLRFFATLAGCRGAPRQRAVADALAAVGLAEVADRRVDRYSSGMRGRLAVARALVGRPPVILADEPTRSLDQGSARQVRLALAAAAADGATVVLVSHDAADMAGADQVVVLSEGTVVERLGPRPDRATVAAALARWAGAGG